MFNLFKKKPIPTVKDKRNTTDLKISVVMPVYLGEYDGCANNREERFKLAVTSFLNRKYDNCELIIISDGCDIAENICKKFSLSNGIVFEKIDKQPLFSGNVRAKGVEMATGDVICYLDSDDLLGENHLTTIANAFTDEKLDWVYYNDMVYQPTKPISRNVELVLGSVGTSAIAHRKDCIATWKGCDNYNHDWLFIQQLIKHNPNYKKIYGAEYLVCHIPNIL